MSMVSNDLQSGFGVLIFGFAIQRLKKSSSRREKCWSQKVLHLPLVPLILKDPSQPPPFSMPSKLLIFHSEVKSYCFIVNCVPESVFNYL